MHARRWYSPHRLPVMVAGGVLAGATLAAPAHAAPSYGSNGLFGVNAEIGNGWVTAFIPAGRYRVDQSPSMAPYQSALGFWRRCNDFPCDPAHADHIIATGFATRDVPTFMDILPSDAAVYLYNVTLTTA